MTTYCVLRRSDGAEVYRYTYDTPLALVEFPAEEFEHVECADPPPPPEPVVQVRITLLAFRKRFTPAEKVAIELAALHNAALAVDHPSNLMAAGLRAAMGDQRDAQFIDLRDRDARGGVVGLEEAGILAAGRAAVILDTPPTDDEVWNG